MQLIAPAILSIFISTQLFSQDAGSDTTSKSSLLDTVTIQSFIIPLTMQQSPYYIKHIKNSTLQQSTAMNNAYLLRDQGDVFVQQSQLGGGSPVIRGFEASRILLVVDGVRMNNAIYRTGHLQNILTVDKNILESITIIHGPNSSIYGSDALGGIIDIRTISPFKDLHDNKKVKLQLGSHYNSAVQGFNHHLMANYGNSKLAGLTAVSYNNMQDLRQGANGSHTIKEGWQRKQYIQTINNQDEITNNENHLIQKYSAYKQLDLIQKIAWKANISTTHTFNFQYSTSTDIPRYDRLTDRKNGQLRWAEWYYGPQKRLLGIYNLEKKISHIQSSLHFNLNYQNIKESRFQRLYKDSLRQSRIENIQVFGYNLYLRNYNFKNKKIIIGTDAQLNYLQSTAYNYNIHTQVKDDNLDTRYPDGSNNMNYWGLYTQLMHHSNNQNLHIQAGLRMNYATLSSTFGHNNIMELPYSKASQSNFTYSGNLGLVFNLSASSAINANIATGFRVPNIDDLAKVFESAGGAYLVVPNPDLKAEQAINYELAYSYKHSKMFKLDIAAYYTQLFNAIALGNYQLNGRDSMLYNGHMTAIVANQNKAYAYLYGTNAIISLSPWKALLVTATINYTYGRYKHAGKLTPLDHIPPLYGHVNAAYRFNNNWQVEGSVLYNGKKDISNYSELGEDNEQYATADGMPAWYTCNFYISKNIKDAFYIKTGIENILDLHYRVFASGISAPGRNFLVKLQYKL
jgi:hemoglobin/transferrin/lactoferrin receptor protein